MSSFFSPNPTRSLVLCLQILLAVLPVLLLSQLIRTKCQFVSATDVLLAIGVIGLLVGLIGFALSYFGGYINILASSRLMENTPGTRPKCAF